MQLLYAVTIKQYLHVIRREGSMDLHHQCFDKSNADLGTHIKVVTLYFTEENKKGFFSVYGGRTYITRGGLDGCWAGV